MSTRIFCDRCAKLIDGPVFNLALQLSSCGPRPAWDPADLCGPCAAAIADELHVPRPLGVPESEKP